MVFYPLVKIRLSITANLAAVFAKVSQIVSKPAVPVPITHRLGAAAAAMIAWIRAM